MEKYINLKELKEEFFSQEKSLEIVERIKGRFFNHINNFEEHRDFFDKMLESTLFFLKEYIGLVQ